MNHLETTLETKNPQELLELIDQLLAEYTRLTKEGEPCDMQPIEHAIAVFCSRLNAIPKEQGGAYEGALESLMTKLTNLGKMLQDQQRGLIDSMRSTSTMRKANKAYQTSDAIALPDGLKKVIVLPIAEDE